LKGPFTGLLLADYGASVLRIDRSQPDSHSAGRPRPTPDLLTRRKSSVAIDLKAPAGSALLRSLLRHVDVLIDPFRPGTLESLGLAPEELVERNPRLIIARLTGFRKNDKYKDMAGHDINYLAVSGVLSQLGRKGGPPYPPANILADFAGGGLMCAFGILMALLSRAKTGMGQVVESNMVDGAAYLATFLRYGLKTPTWDKPRGENLLDGGCPFYYVYECKDGGYMAVGALEPKFYRELVRGLDLEQTIPLDKQYDRETWASMKAIFLQRFLQKTRREWERVFNSTDACCTPVLEQTELESKGYEQRPAVFLSETPSLDVSQRDAWESRGLAPGHGGEELLFSWLGWKLGRDYKFDSGGLVQIDGPKL